ncbi:nucleotidyltransferase domain-containing protein [Acinetobacter pittii]|uniref:nucleotidyltransferase domain-containing protein n=1 Tax=Acinetobacter pittii TaxID=48296 RepID=UPI00300B0ECD
MKDNLDTEVLRIYGFGSYFKGAKEFNDIDFLIIHETTTKNSCQAALECKYLILNILNEAHISILSIKEEKSVEFIKKSSARLLGEVYAKNMKTELVQILDNTIRNKCLVSPTYL